MTASTDHPKRLILLGSTGSIGVNTLRVVENLNGAYQVVALAAGRNAETVAEQAKAFGVQQLAMHDEQAAEQLRQLVPDAKVFGGPQATQQLVEATDADILSASIVGAAGLPATISAIERGMDVALANKETLIAAGELIVPLVRKHNIKLLPVDSEHSAIFQCLQGAAEKSVKRIVLTASGGPFRTRPIDEIYNATIEDALNHPTWNMGPKITIDSATMMNKALEVIEAHWLFGLNADQIKVIIHPQSIVHSFVEFTDHSVLAQLGPPDMKTPIQYALTHPDRAHGCSESMDWTQLKQLDFETADPDRFPSLALAYRVIEAGGTSGAILNAANEQAVEAFLAGDIRFGQIVELAAAALDTLAIKPVQDLETILVADGQARQFVAEQIHR
jgi:1-deoxy-D-xylulose-5-phosphate reductoisomerase